MISQQGLKELGSQTDLKLCGELLDRALDFMKLNKDVSDKVEVFVFNKFIESCGYNPNRVLTGDKSGLAVSLELVKVEGQAVSGNLIIHNNLLNDQKDDLAPKIEAVPYKFSKLVNFSFDINGEELELSKCQFKGVSSKNPSVIDASGLSGDFKIALSEIEDSSTRSYYRAIFTSGESVIAKEVKDENPLLSAKM
jgi:hypothetical protein